VSRPRRSNTAIIIYAPWTLDRRLFEERECHPVIALRQTPAVKAGRHKHEWGLLPLRLRGIERVRLHADLTILARLGCALATARAVPLAA
jgi:hypothetical protein